MHVNVNNAENWGKFLFPITITNINDKSYQCNNPLILIPICDTMRKIYKSKNQDELIKFFDNVLETYKINLADDDYFVKISSISGKDVFTTDIFYDNIDEYWSILNELNTQLIMKTTIDLCNYLLNSERIANNIDSDEYIVFRKWIDYKVENEFRCFIKNKSLVAISQYEYGNDLPEYMKLPDMITIVIGNFICKIHNIIPFNDIVIDVAICMKTLNVYFIEFNEFGIYSDTDAGLYDWVHDHKILNGEQFMVDIRLFDEKYIEKKYEV